MDFRNKDTIMRRFLVFFVWEGRKLFVRGINAHSATEACRRVMGKEYNPNMHFAEVKRS